MSSADTIKILKAFFIIISNEEYFPNLKDDIDLAAMTQVSRGKNQL